MGLAKETREILNLLAAGAAEVLLNKKIINRNVSIGQIVYIPDLIIAKNPHSLMDALAKVVRAKDGRSYELKLLNDQIVTRHVSKLVPTSANFNNTRCQSVDPFQIPEITDLIVPSQVDAKFKMDLPRFESDINEDEVEDDVNNVSDIKVEQQTVPCSYSRLAENPDVTVPVEVSDIVHETTQDEDEKRAE